MSVAMRLPLHAVRHRLSRPAGRALSYRGEFGRRIVSGGVLVSFVLGLFGLPMPSAHRADAESPRGELATATVIGAQSRLPDVLAKLIRPQRSGCCCGQAARSAGRCCCCRKTASGRPPACHQRKTASPSSVGEPSRRQSHRSSQPAWNTCGCGVPATGILTSAEPRIIGPPVGVVSHPVLSGRPVRSELAYAGPALTPEPHPPRTLSGDSLS